MTVTGVEAESVRDTVKLNVPNAEGVPEITPVPAASESPPGNAPLAMAHLYAVVPPVAVSVVEYAVPIVPAGKVVVVMASAELRLMVTDAVCEGVLTAVAVTTAVLEAVTVAGAV